MASLPHKKRPIGLRTTSIEIAYSLMSHRRIESSDNDSAISVSMDNAGLEKQQLRPYSTPSRAITPEPTSSFGVSPHLSSSSSPMQSKGIRQTIKNGGLLLLPSFLGDRSRTEEDPKARKRSTQLATLNGLRGVASLVVLNTNFTYNFDHSFLVPYGVNSEKHILTQSPILTVLFSTYTMISVFFVISGYVLSYKPMRHIHGGSASDAHRTLASSALRRAFRLYFPVALVTLCIGLASWVGIFDCARANYGHESNRWDMPEAPPPRFEKLQDQLRDVGNRLFELVDIWYTRDGERSTNQYDPHIWTVPVTMRNSIITYAVLMMTSRLRTRYRLMSTFAAISFCVSTQNRSMTLFLAGMFLADLDQWRMSKLRYISLTPKSHQKKSRLLQAFGASSPVYLLLFVGGLFLCSIAPYGADHDPIFKHIYQWVPSTWTERAEWARAPGAILIVWSVANSSLMSPLFHNRVLTYFGNISFSVFLVHGAIIRGILYANLPRIYRSLAIISTSTSTNGEPFNQSPYRPTRNDLNTSRMIVAWLWGAVICIPLVLWVADLFWRLIEQPSIEFSKWTESKLLEADNDIGSPTGTSKRWTD